MPGPLNSATARRPSTTGASSFCLPPNSVWIAAGMSMPVVAETVATFRPTPWICRSAELISPACAKAAASKETMTTTKRLMWIDAITESPSGNVRDGRGGAGHELDLLLDGDVARDNETGTGGNGHGIGGRRLAADAHDAGAQLDAIAVELHGRDLFDRQRVEVVALAGRRRHSPAAALAGGGEDEVMLGAARERIRGADQHFQRAFRDEHGAVERDFDFVLHARRGHVGFE